MPSVKGKEKAVEPQDNDGEHGSTLFVSGIPFSTTSKEFEAVFADFAPVRHAFVVTHKDQKTGETRGKGVGIVSFGVREDAEDVLSRFGSGEETLKISGRTLHLEWAKKRHSRLEGDAASPSKAPRLKSEPEPEPPSHTSSKSTQPTTTAALSASPKKPPTKSTDPVAKRTVVLSGLSSSTTDKALWKKIRKLSGAVSISFPLEGEPGVAHAVFHDEKETANAVSRLDGRTFKGAEIGAVPLAEGSAGKQKTKSNSLIIRNLPRKITENDLRTVFSKYGEIKTISLPATNDATRAPPRFAFIWMTRRSDAEAAVKALSGARMKPGGVIDGAKSKAGGSAAVKDEDVEMKDPLKETMNDGSRVVAVDFAMSKSRWEEAKRNAMVEDDEDEVKEEDEDVESEEGEDDDEMDVDDDEENASDSEEEDEEEADGTAVEHGDGGSSESELDGDDPRLNFDDEDSDDWTDGDGEDQDEAGSKTKQQKSEPAEGTTLFVRNIPFEATDDDLYEVFKTFGPLRYARIAFDHATGRSRGTGFVCFWKREVAQEVLKEAERMRVLAGVASGTKPIKHTAHQSHSILTPDPSSSVAAKLVLMGRTLDVVPAVSKDDAHNLKEAAEKIKEKKADNRNLYLLREGVIFEDSPAAKTMPPAALKARLASYDQRRSTLRSNPALYISQTRLSVRNLPRFVTERCLRHLGIHAMKAFNEEVKAGERDGVSKDEVEVDQEMVKDGKKKSKSKNSGALKQAKVSRHRTQVDPMHPQGLGRSDGFGFLEMEKHTDALRVLRWANNRPGVVELLWGWWKEELEETVRRVKENPDALKGKKGKDKEWSGVDGTTLVEVEDSKVKLERWEKTLKEMEAEGCQERDRPLLVEFAMENKVVTKRREEKMSKSRTPSKGKTPLPQPSGFGVKKRKTESFEDGDEGTVREAKKLKGERPGERDGGRAKAKGKSGKRKQKRAFI